MVLESCIVSRELILIARCSNGCLILTRSKILRCAFELLHGINWPRPLSSRTILPYYRLHILVYFDHSILAVLVNVHNRILLLRGLILPKSVHDSFLLLSVILTHTYLSSHIYCVLVTLTGGVDQL